ncbi:hypothetical protein M9H77_06269 [Catharanthus roseus]|uniref:Uncharacterized protein n=1 Tax=Catharanthus roseus TaxID=4058 RepID=A0ACC0BRN7_CATRO|nr:hypothetical protein M9H77_06269 [Catharanthus roseus]
MRRVLLIFSVDVSVAIYLCHTLQLPIGCVQQDLLAPLGAMWCTLFDYSQLPTHTLITYRDQLDFMPSDQIQRQIVSITDDRNTINMMEHVTAITQMVSNELCMLYPTVNNDNDEIDHSDEDYVVSSQSKSDNNKDGEEEELQTLVNPVNENTVT